jgi:hypothetical protein
MSRGYKLYIYIYICCIHLHRSLQNPYVEIRVLTIYCYIGNNGESPFQNTVNTIKNNLNTEARNRLRLERPPSNHI